MIVYNWGINHTPEREIVMTAINNALLTIAENPIYRENFGAKLIQTSNANDYVCAGEHTVMELKYDGVSLLDLLWQNGNDFKGFDYNRPTTKLEIYPDTDRQVRTFDNWCSGAEDDEKAELVDFFNEKMIKSGRDERFTEDDIDYLYQAVRDNEPESPSEDVDDYLYDVDIITWVNSENGSYPESKETKVGLTYDELRELQRENDTQVSKVYLKS
jgi:hypothetical protein